MKVKLRAIASAILATVGVFWLTGFIYWFGSSGLTPGKAMGSHGGILVLYLVFPPFLLGTIGALLGYKVDGIGRIGFWAGISAVAGAAAYWMAAIVDAG